MANNEFGDIEELARLRLAHKSDEWARERIVAFREIRQDAAKNGILESSGVVWAKKLEFLQAQMRTRAHAIAQIWHGLIQEARGEFTDAASAFVAAEVDSAMAVRRPIDVDGVRPPAGLERQFEDAAAHAAHEAKQWIAERRIEARMGAQESKSPASLVPERTDATTGLNDKGAFNARLAAEMPSAGANEPLSLVMIDLDYFKQINDKHGHPAGDEVLRTVAQLVARVGRCKGTAFRWGGEEFALLLPNHTTEEAVAVAERTRREIESHPVGSINVTASFGVAEVPAHASDAASLLKRADEALYDAKSRGRNVVRACGDPPPTSSGPREVRRKQATDSWLSREQKIALRREIIRVASAACPDDGAPLTIHDITHMGSVGREFLVSCPDCGRSDQLLSGSA